MMTLANVIGVAGKRPTLRIARCAQMLRSRVELDRTLRSDLAFALRCAMMPDRALRFSLVSVALGLRPLLWLFAGGPANFQASPLPPTSGMLAGLLACWLAGWAGRGVLGWAGLCSRCALHPGSRIAPWSARCAWHLDRASRSLRVAPQIAPGLRPLLRLRLERTTPRIRI